MKTNYTRQLLPLAAIALIASACDPFPAKPGGDPAIVRVTTTDQSWTLHTNTVDNAGAAGTASNANAFPLDQVYIQFNKPMSGSTLQKYPDFDANGNPTSVASLPAADQATGICTPPTNLTHTFGAGTTFCYMPSAPTDGGQLIITPGSAMVVGASYSVTGTVKDYEGKSLTIDVTVSVDPLPQTSTIDGLKYPGNGISYAYGLIVDWFPTGAASYTLEWAPDNAGAPGTWTPIAIPLTACSEAQDSPPGTAGSAGLGYDVCEYTFTELPASTQYWVRVGDGDAPTTWREIAAPASTRSKLGVTLTNFALSTAPSVLVPGAVGLAWGRVAGGTSGLDPAQPWVVERAPDVSGAAGTFADITATLVDAAGAPRLLTSTSRSAADLNATPPGTRYWYRVRPNYLSTTVYDGKASARTSYKAP